MELKRIGWYNEEAFAHFFNNFYEEVFTLYNEIHSNIQTEKENMKIWLESLSERSSLMCLSIKEGEIQYSYLFVIEKFPFGEFITNCYRFYKDWDMDYAKLSKAELIKQFDYYDQYTDNIPDVYLEGVDKPNLSYFKEHENELLQEEYFQGESWLFQFKTPTHVLFEKYPEIKEKMLPFTPEDLNVKKTYNVNIESFFYMIDDIVRVGNAVQTFLEKDPDFLQRIGTLENEISEFVSKGLFFSGYDVGSLVKMCQKKKAGSKKTALDGKYADAWITRKGKRKTLVIDYCNWRDYTYVFVIHELKDGYAFFDCYRVFDEWEESTKDDKSSRYIKMMGSSIENYTDLESKPTLNQLLSNLEEYKPIFSFKENIEEDSLYHYKSENLHVSFDAETFAFNAKEIERAIGLLDWFQEILG